MMKKFRIVIKTSLFILIIGGLIYSNYKIIILERKIESNKKNYEENKNISNNIKKEIELLDSDEKIENIENKIQELDSKINNIENDYKNSDSELLNKINSVNTSTLDNRISSCENNIVDINNYLYKFKGCLGAHVYPSTIYFNSCMNK